MLLTEPSPVVKGIQSSSDSSLGSSDVSQTLGSVLSSMLLPLASFQRRLFPTAFPTSKNGTAFPGSQSCMHQNPRHTQSLSQPWVHMHIFHTGLGKGTSDPNLYLTLPAGPQSSHAQNSNLTKDFVINLSSAATLDQDLTLDLDWE